MSGTKLPGGVRRSKDSGTTCRKEEFQELRHQQNKVEIYRYRAEPDHRT